MFAEFAGGGGIATDTPVGVDAIHAHAPVLALVLDAIINVDLAERPRKTRWAYARVIGAQDGGRPADSTASGAADTTAPMITRAVESGCIHLWCHRAGILRPPLSLSGRAVVVFQQYKDHSFRLSRAAGPIDGVVLDVDDLVVAQISDERMADVWERQIKW